MSLHRGPTLPYSVVAGVTPCPPGWLAHSAKIHGATFAPESARVYTTFVEILSEHPSYEVIVINAPIGYPLRPEDGPRTCDLEARALVGVRASAIRNAPSRAVLNGLVEWKDASLDAVSLSLLPRYREVAAEMSPYRQRTVYEGSPELSFYQLNQDSSMLRSKVIEEGHDERLAVLEAHIPGLENMLDAPIDGVQPQHHHDALALMWTARRVYGHAARRIPKDPEWDSEGLRMEIVF